MIELEHVTKLYGSIPALRDVSLHVPKGQIVGLLGRNGAGKTTAMNLMTGYFPPTEGRVRIGGKDMLADPRSCKRMIGYLPERPPLYDEMTVREYLGFVSELREVVKKANKAHVEEILELCALKEVRHRVIGHLSKGYRQRAGIAQALCGSPEILILDEPTAGLDPAGSRQIMENIENYRKSSGATVMIVTHSMDDAARYSNRLMVFDHGRLRMDGSPEDIFSKENELRSIGLDIPAAMELAAALRGRGIPLEGTIFTHEQLLGAIRKSREVPAC